MATGNPVDLSSSHQTYYVPKPGTATADLADQRKYYRYQIRSGGARVVRAEWVNTNNTTANGSFTGQTANTLNWTNGGGNGSTSTSGSQTFTVNAGVTQVVITTSGTLGTNRNPGIYVNLGANPSLTATYAQTPPGATSMKR